MTAVERSHDVAGLAAGMRLYAMDAWVGHPEVLVDADRLAELLRTAAAAGPATILGEKFCTFPNGAVTGVLILAQSHLSLHTWPELLLANVDLLSYGRIDGDAILKTIEEGLEAERVSITCVPRGRS